MATLNRNVPSTRTVRIISGAPRRTFPRTVAQPTTLAPKGKQVQIRRFVPRPPWQKRYDTRIGIPDSVAPVVTPVDNVVAAPTLEEAQAVNDGSAPAVTTAPNITAMNEDAWNFVDSFQPSAASVVDPNATPVDPSTVPLDVADQAVTSELASSNIGTYLVYGALAIGGLFMLRGFMK